MPRAIIERQMFEIRNGREVCPNCDMTNLYTHDGGLKCFSCAREFGTAEPEARQERQSQYSPDFKLAAVALAVDLGKMSHFGRLHTAN